jgi:Cu(I)/Ag(I) efflux system membrane fusion protein
LPKLDVTGAQRAAVTEFFKAADAVGASLAADDIGKYNIDIETIPQIVSAMAEAFPGDHPWAAQIDTIKASSPLASSGSLDEARQVFLPFSKATTDFARMARQQNESFGSVKIYRCPMAPKPGLWIQMEGPLQNPYYGEEMLECGNEVKQ